MKTFVLNHVLSRKGMSLVLSSFLLLAAAPIGKALVVTQKNKQSRPKHLQKAAPDRPTTKAPRPTPPNKPRRK